MWELSWKILLLVLLGSVYTEGNTLEKNTDDTFESRLNKLEGLVASQIESQKTLQEALHRETESRNSLEEDLSELKEQQKVKLEDLSAALRVTSDRVAALDGSLQDEIRLREEAEIEAKDVLLELSRKISMVERDLGQLTLMNSRLREIEGQKGIQNEEILNLSNTVAQLRKALMRERREVQKNQASLEALAHLSSEQTNSLASYDSRLGHMMSWIHSHNGTNHKSVDLQEVKADVLQLTEGLLEIEVSITNLTESVDHLHHLAPTKMLKLCPTGYRKVGDDCLQFIDSKSSWGTARLKCEELGILSGGIGDLAVPTSLPEFRSFVHKIETDSDYLWVGAKRDDDDIWRWVTGVNLEEKDIPWDLLEPDNSQNQYQLCVRSDGNIKFHDCVEDASLNAICQLF